jgi:putative FmdB family regulatory protein
MPTYDYLCENGHRFELFQSMMDAAITQCQECDAPVKRLIGPGAGFLFKGGGFYITENRSKEYKKQAHADSKPSSKSTSSTSSASGSSASGASESSAKKESSSSESSSGSSKSKDTGKGSGGASGS